MDGHFVPNLTFGHPIVTCLRPKLPANTFIDVHMMVANPEKWIADMAAAGANQYTFHVETTDRVMECIHQIKSANMQVGLAIKPGTPVDTVLMYADFIDTVLIMTVEPGFGGQQFMHNMMPKVELLRQRYPTLNIQVDGGVGPNTIQACAEAGANMIVSGSAIVNSHSPYQVMSMMRQTVADAIQLRSHANAQCS
jgi:ribulose-phosphate 3-epimerase